MVNFLKGNCSCKIVGQCMFLVVMLEEMQFVMAKLEGSFRSISKSHFVLVGVYGDEKMDVTIDLKKT